MTTFQQEDWVRYILGEAEPAQEREMEQLLLHSEEAMKQYLYAMELVSQDMPVMKDEEAFTQQVMAMFDAEVQRTSAQPLHDPHRLRSRVRKWYEHPLFHYTVAASITFLLLTSGVFDSLLHEPKALLNQPSGSISDSIMHKALSILDQWTK